MVGLIIVKTFTLLAFKIWFLSDNEQTTKVQIQSWSNIPSLPPSHTLQSIYFFVSKMICKAWENAPITFSITQKMEKK
jgi:hypothetical protein